MAVIGHNWSSYFLGLSCRKIRQALSYLNTYSLTGDDCSKYFHCSDTFVPDNDVCLSSEFGGGRVFEKHNFYDVSQRKALQPQQIDTHRIIETVASPGTSNFYRLTASIGLCRPGGAVVWLIYLLFTVFEWQVINTLATKGRFKLGGPTEV